MYTNSLSTTTLSIKLLQGGIYTLNLAILSGFLKSLFHGRAPSSPWTLVVAPDSNNRSTAWVGENTPAQWVILITQMGWGTGWG